MSFEVKLSPQLGAGLLAWDDKLHAVWQTMNHARLMIDPLNDMSMKKCAHAAGEIYQDIRTQLMSGELTARMLRQHAKEHPCLREQVGSEVIRQFNNVLFPYLFWEHDDTNELELLKAVEEFLGAAKDAVDRKGEGDEDAHQ